jgi:hypothetical protein
MLFVFHNFFLLPANPVSIFYRFCMNVDAEDFPKTFVPLYGLTSHKTAIFKVTAVESEMYYVY